MMPLMLLLMMKLSIDIEVLLMPLAGWFVSCQGCVCFASVLVLLMLTPYSVQAQGSYIQ